MPRTRYFFCVMSLLLAALTASASPAASSKPQRLALSDVSQLASEDGRQLLRYLISCALDAQVVMEAEVDGVRYEFPGALGLAPQWHKRGLNSEEERWVSACIFARTNYFGVPVKLSMTSPFPNSAPGLEALYEEDKAYPVEEATYFGNIFAAQPVAYVCGRNDAPERKLQISAHKRICALPLDKALPDGRQVTACDFVYLGACSAGTFTQGGVDYQQAIRVSLPMTPAAAAP